MKVDVEYMTKKNRGRRRDSMYSIISVLLMTFKLFKNI